jgi:N-acyl-D-amino-acid deacylase
LAAEMSGRNGICTTHMRDEGTGLVISVEEALRIGREAGVNVQISHHKAAGRPSWGLVREALELIEQAQLRGQTVFADQYPYTAGSTVLAAVLQNEMFGDRDDAPSTPADVVIASCSPHPEWEGRNLAELSDQFGCTGTEAAERVLREAPTTTVITHMMNEDDVRTVMTHASTMIGSDGIPTVGAKPHCSQTGHDALLRSSHPAKTHTHKSKLNSSRWSLPGGLASTPRQSNIRTWPDGTCYLSNASTVQPEGHAG